MNSAGLLMYRRPGRYVEVLLAHPGGPFFAKKDAGAWTVPKGEIAEGETPLDAARREFEEETSFPLTAREFLPLGEVRQIGGKRVVAWACAGDCDPAALVSPEVTIDWPPRSGRKLSFPEIDRVEWFPLEEAGVRIHPTQVPFLDRLVEALRERSG